VYFPGEAVQGVVVVQSKGTMSHNGIRLVASGRIKLLASGKDQTVLENLGSAAEDPLKLLNVVIDVAKEGKLPNGTTELPFEFLLQPDAAAKLCETYHGVYVNVHYTIDVEMKRGFPKSDLQAKTEWMVQIPPEATKKKNVKPPVVVPFDITPESLENVKARSSRFGLFFSYFLSGIVFEQGAQVQDCGTSRQRSVRHYAAAFGRGEDRELRRGDSVGGDSARAHRDSGRPGDWFHERGKPEKKRKNRVLTNRHRRPKCRISRLQTAIRRAAFPFRFT
jgi:hypothetical protein